MHEALTDRGQRGTALLDGEWNPACRDRAAEIRAVGVDGDVGCELAFSVRIEGSVGSTLSSSAACPAAIVNAPRIAP